MMYELLLYIWAISVIILDIITINILKNYYGRL